jgi:hydrogenase expression/formation protein HypE
MIDKIMLSMGSGGVDSKKLVDFIAGFIGNPALAPFDDAGIVNISSQRLAMTTDGFVVKPIFFPGGDIGKLSVCGSLNDLAVMAAEPIALSLSFVIEEGFSSEDFARICASIKESAGDVPIVTGDTKVVNKGAVDGIFVTTTGLGIQNQYCKPSGSSVLPGDALIITGSIGRHGASIMAKREELGFLGEITSDVAHLWPMLSSVFQKFQDAIHACRDITRGGLATMLSEFAISSGVGMEVAEDNILIDADVSGLCMALGLDPFILACEGRAILAVDQQCAQEVLDLLKSNELGACASVIGNATQDHPKTTYLVTSLGGKRILDPPAGELLPRIC